jgi:hypothetical protein
MQVEDFPYIKILSADYTDYADFENGPTVNW